MLAVALALVTGLTVGVIVGVLIVRRQPGDDDAPVPGRPSEGPAPVPASVPAVTEDVATLLREAVDHLETAVMVFGPGGVVRFRNAAALAQQGTHVGVLVDDRTRDVVAETVGGGRASRVIELHGPPRQWLELTVDPLPGGGAIAAVRDVSERMRNDSMRTDFVTNVSHELKTPVGAMAVLAETLLDEPDPELVARIAPRLVDEAHRAVHTIDDLLALSQIEGVRPGDDSVDVNAVVAEAIERGRAAANGRGIEIVAPGGPAPLAIRGDAGQLASAVGNLVENAVKYSNEGGRVEVRTRVDDRVVEVVVVDEGIGIPARDLDRVFERFYRVDRARSRATGGTGLGLSIVRNVAANHGGEVSVSSQEGEGSTFVLRLPAARIVTAPDVARDGSGDA